MEKAVLFLSLGIQAPLTRFVDAPHLVLFVIAVVDLILGFIVFIKARRSFIHALFFLISAAIALWSFSLILSRAASEPSLIVLGSRLRYAWGGVVALLFVFFAARFPSTNVPLRKKEYILFVPFLIIEFLVFFSTFIVAGAHSSDEGNIEQLGRFYVLLPLYVLSYFLIGLFLLFRRFFSTRAVVERAQIRYVLAGTIIPLVITVFTNIYLPSVANNFHYTWLGPASTFIMVALFSYAISKHHLFNIRVISAEVLSALLILLLFFQIVFAPTASLLALNGLILFIVAIFAVLLLRGVFREIDERERAESLARELQRANENLRTLDQAKSAFISLASHQLRTPLTAIKGYISMALEDRFGVIPERAKHALHDVYLSNERLMELVNEFLNISRIESGKMEYTIQPRNLDDLVVSVIEELRPAAEAKGLSLQFSPDREGSVTAKIDEEKIRQSFLNIIDNAIKYTSKGRVAVALGRKDGMALLSVSDTGIGMTREDIESIFKPFARGSMGAQLDARGAGLGLYIAKQFVQAQGGSLLAESEGPEKGSTFFLSLPLA